MANAAYSPNLGFRLDKDQKMSGHALRTYIREFNEKLMAPYLGMGTGRDINSVNGEGWVTFLGFDIHVGYLLDCTQTQEELERQYKAFSGLLHANRSQIYESRPICAEIQRQLDAWRAGR